MVFTSSVSVMFPVLRLLKLEPEDGSVLSHKSRVFVIDMAAEDFVQFKESWIISKVHKSVHDLSLIHIYAACTECHCVPEDPGRGLEGGLYGAH